ncbi:MAG: AraC family transcriptional regulator [Luteolibacter sp.]
MLHSPTAAPVEIASLGLDVLEPLATLLPIADKSGLTEPLELHDPNEVPVPGKNSALKIAFDHLIENYTESLELPALATRCGMTGKSLRSSFKRILGITPNECLIRIRVHHAMRLLAETDTPIKSIAETVGFYDHSNLTHQFSKVVGLSPSIYRDKHRARTFYRTLEAISKGR